MYIATRDLYSRGSTPLHLDATSAVNILVHVEPDESGEDGALWHIFSGDDTPSLREYLRQTGNTSPDPIHAQSTYLTDPMLADLWTQYRIKPYRIVQRYGDAVFIPAGCPHQVCYLTYLLFCFLNNTRSATGAVVSRSPVTFCVWKASPPLGRFQPSFGYSVTRTFCSLTSCCGTLGPP